MPGWLSSTQRWRVSAGLATQWTADTVCELLARPVVVATNTNAASAAAAAAADPLSSAAAATATATATAADTSTNRPAGSASHDDDDAHFRFDAAWWAKLGDDLWRRPRVLQWLDAQCVTDSAPTPGDTAAAAAAADAFDANEAAARLLNNLQDP